MLKGEKKHNRRKSCRIRINYLIEQIKRGFIKNILKSMKNVPFKLKKAQFLPLK